MASLTNFEKTFIQNQKPSKLRKISKEKCTIGDVYITAETQVRYEVVGFFVNDESVPLLQELQELKEGAPHADRFVSCLRATPSWKNLKKSWCLRNETLSKINAN